MPSGVSGIAADWGDAARLRDREVSGREGFAGLAGSAGGQSSIDHR